MDIAQALVEGPPAKLKRRMRTNAEKRGMVEETFADGTSVAAVARRHDVNADLLFNWRKLYRQGLLGHCREPAAVPVGVEAEADDREIEEV